MTVLAGPYQANNTDYLMPAKLHDPCCKMTNMYMMPHMYRHPGPEIREDGHHEARSVFRCPSSRLNSCYASSKACQANSTAHVQLCQQLSLHLHDTIPLMRESDEFEPLLEC